MIHLVYLWLVRVKRLMDQLTLWKKEPASPQFQVPNAIKQDLLRKIAQLLLEVVVEPSSENESRDDDE
jgi:hypothetical protein